MFWKNKIVKKRSVIYIWDIKKRRGGSCQFLILKGYGKCRPRQL